MQHGGSGRIPVTLEQVPMRFKFYIPASTVWTLVLQLDFRQFDRYSSEGSRGFSQVCSFQEVSKLESQVELSLWCVFSGSGDSRSSWFGSSKETSFRSIRTRVFDGFSSVGFRFPLIENICLWSYRFWDIVVQFSICCSEGSGRWQWTSFYVSAKISLYWLSMSSTIWLWKTMWTVMLADSICGRSSVGPNTMATLWTDILLESLWLITLKHAEMEVRTGAVLVLVLLQSGWAHLRRCLKSSFMVS